MYFIRVCPSHLPHETIKNSSAQVEWLYTPLLPLNPFQMLRGWGVKIYHHKETQKWCFTESLQWKAKAHISSLVPEKDCCCYMQFRYCHGYECSVFPFIGFNSRAISQTLRSETKSSSHLSTFFQRLRVATSTRLGLWLVRVISSVCL